MLFSRKCQRHQEKWIKVLLNYFPPFVKGTFILSVLKVVFILSLSVYLFFGCPGLRGCSHAFSSCSKWGLLFVILCRLLIEVTSLIVEHRSVASCEHGLGCPRSCGIFPDQGSNPCVLRWQVDSYPVDPLGSSVLLFLTTELRTLKEVRQR